jgi:hypothetical protein
MELGFYEKNKLALTIFSSQNHKDLILDEVRDSKTDSRFCGMLLQNDGGVHSKVASKKYSFFHEIIIC